MSHNLLTAYEFIDIDKMNAVNFTNFMYYTRLNPTVIGKDFHRYVSAHDADIDRLSNIGGLLYRFKNTHSYFSRFWESYHNNVFFAKKEDGYHLVLITESVNVIISPNHYNHIFLASSSYKPGFQIGNKYGYLFDKIDYQRIMIDLDYHKVYDFYGSYDNRIYISKELIVENNYIVGYKTEKKYRKKRLGKYHEQLWPY